MKQLTCEEPSSDELNNSTRQTNNNSNREEEKHNLFFDTISLKIHDIISKLEVSDEVANKILEEILLLIKSSKKDANNNETINNNHICNYLQKLFEHEYEGKMILMQRAISWLGFCDLSTKENYINFIHKMIELGNILSEDNIVKQEENHTIVSKEAAQQQRSILFSNNEFKQSLMNKQHPLHKESVAQIRNLNKIIVS